LCIQTLSGFLPGREALQSWLQVQASVELAHQTGQALSGLAVDFVKAFNNIRRPQWFKLARHIGLPERILRPWQKFLASFTRRFQVHNHLSDPLTSNVGFAEGDPLSVPAMAVLDWALQIYQSQFAPLTRTMSYVDNIAMMSKFVINLVWAFFSLCSFLDFWGLEIDTGKSYMWSTATGSRAQLAPLGLKMVDDVSELGGSLTFHAAPRVRIFLARGAKLEQRWRRLRLSKAPLKQKLICLPAVFWASALHGALGCIFADCHLHQLRKRAIAALGLRVGGVNPLLRLTLAQPHTADPGYYHLRHCVFDFRRICRKTPDLLALWRQYMSHFGGRNIPGPFYKMVELFSQIGWSLATPPTFSDHDGFSFDLLQIHNCALDALLLDAWLNYVATQVNHRSTMKDLDGLCAELTLLDRQLLTPLELSRTMALQSGAFISEWHHAKYDPSKTPICPSCLVPNTQRHWFQCPLFAAIREEMGESFEWLTEVPDCIAYHLLMPRSPFARALKTYFMGLSDLTETFYSTPGEGLQHLFSDGSFFPESCKTIGVAAWSLVNATTGQTIGAGPLPGLVQSISRAELSGALAALKWVASYRTVACLWSDSKTTVDGLQALLAGRWNPHDAACENHDLWQQIAHLLEDLPEGSFMAFWIPSHLDVVQCASAWEEWIALWNAAADQLAVQANIARTDDFMQLKTNVSQHHELWSSRLRLLRRFYFMVAEQKEQAAEVIDLTASESFDWPSLGVDLALSDVIPVNWKSLLSSPHVQMKYPHEFVFMLFEAVFSFEQHAEILAPISYVEIALWCIGDGGISFPFWNPSLSDWELRPYHSLLLKPTIASVVQVVRLVLRKGLQTMGLEQYLLKGIRKHEAGLLLPVDGIGLCTNFATANSLASCCLQAAGQRRFRKAADLARPL
jgi:ribonuclease HI